MIKAQYSGVINSIKSALRRTHRTMYLGMCGASVCAPNERNIRNEMNKSKVNEICVNGIIKKASGESNKHKFIFYCD